MIEFNNKPAKLFASLTSIQLLNYLIPFIALPHILKAIGSGAYGIFSFAFAVVAYFNIVVEYGFNISGVKKIARLKNSCEKLSVVFSVIFACKIFLFFLSLFVFIVSLNLISLFKINAKFLIAAYLFAAGSVFNPRWFLLGLEDLKLYIAVTFAVKILWLPSVFIFINRSSDVLLLIYLTSGAFLLTSILSFILSILKFKIKIEVPTFNSIKKELSTSFSLFLSNLYIFLYTNSHVFILSLFADFKTVGLFAAVNKIINGIKELFWNFTQAEFPRISRKTEFNFNEVKNELKRYLKLGTILGLVIAFLLIAFSGAIVRIYLGAEFKEARLLLILLSFVPVIVFLSNIYGYHLMVALNYEKEFTERIMLSSIAYLVFSLLLTPRFYAIGTAVVILITELLITLNFRIFLKKKNIF